MVEQELIIEGFKISPHAKGRTTQRGLETEEIKNTIKFGRSFATSNGRKVFFLGAREIRKNRLPEEYANSAIVVCINRKKIVTCIKNAEIKNLKKFKDN